MFRSIWSWSPCIVDSTLLRDRHVKIFWGLKFLSFMKLSIIVLQYFLWLQISCVVEVFSLGNVVLKWDLCKNHIGNLWETQILTSSSQSFRINRSEIGPRTLLLLISILEQLRSRWSLDAIFRNTILDYSYLIETYPRQFTQKSSREFRLKWWIKKRNTRVNYMFTGIFHRKDVVELQSLILMFYENAFLFKFFFAVKNIWYKCLSKHSMLSKR